MRKDNHHHMIDNETRTAADCVADHGLGSVISESKSDPSCHEATQSDRLRFDGHKKYIGFSHSDNSVPGEKTEIARKVPKLLLNKPGIHAGNQVDKGESRLKHDDELVSDESTPLLKVSNPKQSYA